MTLAPLSQQCQRIIALQEQICEALDDAECSWAEAVGCMGFALSVLLDQQEDERMRVAMAAEVGKRLINGAWSRGSFGEPERMQ
jgi:hypothetical protein